MNSTPPISQPQPESSASGGFSWLSAHAISLATVAGLLVIVIVGMVLGTGITGYPAMAADEGNYLEQAWAANHDALSQATSWCEGRRLWPSGLGRRTRNWRLLSSAAGRLSTMKYRTVGPASGRLTA